MEDLIELQAKEFGELLMIAELLINNL